VDRNAEIVALPTTTLVYGAITFDKIKAEMSYFQRLLQYPLPIPFTHGTLVSYQPCFPVQQYQADVLTSAKNLRNVDSPKAGSALPECAPAPKRPLVLMSAIAIQSS
jgi:hypothetical protein